MIDPSIPLQIQPPKIDDPLAAYGKLLNIQNAQQQQQMGAQKIQSNAMELKQQQQNMDAENALNTVLKSHTSIGEDGNIRIDHAGVTKDLVNLGFSQQALKFDAGRNAAMKAALDAEKDRVEVVGKKNEQLANIAGNVGKLDQAETDPIKKQQNIAAWNGRAQMALGQAIDQGLVNPQAIPQLKAAVAQGWSPELEQQLDAFAGAATTNVQRHAIAHQELTGLQSKLTGDATVKHLNAETAGLEQTQADKARSDLTVLLSKAKTPAEYDSIMAAKPEISAGLPRSSSLHFTKNGLADDSAENVVTSGMNATQLDQHNARKDAESLRKLSTESLIESRKATEVFRQDSLDLRRSMLEGQPKPAQKADAARLDFNQKALAPLSKQAGLLATALGDGKPEHVLANGMFVDDKGNQVEISKKLGTDNPTPEQVKSLIDQMKADLNSTKTRMVGITNASHDIMERWGGTPSVSREDSLASINRIGSGATGTDKTGPPTTAANPPSAKPSAKPAQAQPTAKAIDVPPTIASGLTVGIPRKVNSPSGVITIVKKADGKVYQQ